VAELGDSFSGAPGAVPLAQLRAACPRYTDQLSIQQMDMLALLPVLRSVSALRGVLGGLSDGSGEEAASPSYEPRDSDTRTVAERQVRARRGQPEFRRALTERYGACCMVTGCLLMDIVEAAHISPYRGVEDNHVENGLLLRADIHTLFDIHLLGIEPDSLEVVLGPGAADGGYGSMAGRRVATGSVRPSRAALMSRWGLFQQRNARDQ
jgi:hypothetical protein